MKAMFTLFSVLSLFTINPTTSTSKDIKLDKKHKVERTFSGNTVGEDSFHLIIAKNTESKAFDIIPYHYKSDELIELNTIQFEEKPEVISFHNSGDVLSLITKSEEGKSEKFRVLDINLITGLIKKSDGFSTDDFKAVIREKDKNMLLYAKKKSITLVNVRNATAIESIEIEPSEGSQEFFKLLSKSNIDAINTNEFVKNGSIMDFRVYSEDGMLTVTQEDSKEGLTNVVQIPTVSSSKLTADVEIFTSTSVNGKIKKSTSYFSNDKLYQLKLGKDDVKLDVFDMQSDNKTTIDILNSELRDVVSKKKNIDEFNRNATKNANAPTVTINKAKKGGVKVRLDYVNKNDYNYQYDWWWHHHWMMHHMMWQQQQQQQMHMRATGFGPNMVKDVFYKKDKDNFFEIGLDINGNIVSPENLLETVHKEIDKKSYIESLDENKKLKHASTVFTQNQFRYVAYNKSTKSFVIINKSLDD